MSRRVSPAAGGPANVLSVTPAVAREPAEQDLSTVESRVPRAQGSPLPRSDRMLGLQRAIGNAAVGRLVRGERLALARACCASCAAGRCRESEEDEEYERGRSALARAVAARRAAAPSPASGPPARCVARRRRPLGGRRLQRLGDTSRIPSPLPTSTAPPPVDSVMFPNAVSALDPLQREQIENLVRNWRADGGTQPVRVDGFASTPGSDELNWRLSCDRAQAVAVELQHPTSGTSGMPANLISVFMQGETTEFGSPPKANRRVTLFMPTRQPPPPRARRREPPPHEAPRRSCGPEISWQLTDVLTRVQHDFNDPSLPEWRKELACHNLVVPNPYAIMGWDILDLFLPSTAWLGGQCGGHPRRIDEPEDPATCGNSVEVDQKCWLAGTVNYAMYGTACKLCYDRRRRTGVMAPAPLPPNFNPWSRFWMRSCVRAYNVGDRMGGGISPPLAWATATYDHGPSGRPAGPSNRSSCPVGCGPASRSRFDYAWPPIRGEVRH